MWQGNSLSTKGNCLKQKEICYTLSSQWHMRAPSILVGKMVSSLALTYVRYLSHLPEMQVWIDWNYLRLKVKFLADSFQSRAWKKNLKSQNISFQYFSTETPLILFFFFFSLQNAMFLNLTQFREGKRKQHPNPAFGASPPLPPSLLRQKGWQLA